MNKKKADQQASPQRSGRNTITVANAPTKTSRILAYLVAGGSPTASKPSAWAITA